MTRQILWYLTLIFVCGCSTLSQTYESPIVMQKQKYAIGLGTTYTHNINQFEGDEAQKEESVPIAFVGGRYGLLQNFEIGLSGGTLGLADGTSLDLRVRYMWLGGWKDPAAKIAKLEDDEDMEFDDEDLEDRPPYVPNGWMSTLSAGIFWSGYNDIQDYSAGQFDTGLYASNSIGWKKGNHVYYFGGKAIQLETSYKYKSNRLSLLYDVDSKYSQLTFGVFAGYTYSWKSRKKHLYSIDTMITVLQLPKDPTDRTNKYYPALTIAGWFID